jgi:hypothetical protein
MCLDSPPAAGWKAQRERLPDRRGALTFSFENGNLHYVATVSWFADGRVGEIFLSNHKSGSQADSNARDSAIAASLALQYGMPLAVLQGAVLRDSHGRPSTPLGQALDHIVEMERR